MEATQSTSLSTSSTPSGDPSASLAPPLHLSLVRTIDGDGGVERSVMEVALQDFRFSMGAVLLRLSDFVPPPLPPLPAQAPPTLVQGGDGEEETFDFSLLTSEASAVTSAASSALSPPVPPPSSLSLRLRMVRPVLQLVADPTVPVSPALLLTWSAALQVDRHSEGGRDTLKVSGDLQRVTCGVTELDVDNRQRGREDGRTLSRGTQDRAEAAPLDLSVSSREAAVVLSPFDVSCEVTQFSSTALSFPPSLPRRSVVVTVEPIVLRFSYSSYHLVSTTLSTLLQQQRQSVTASQSLPDRSIGVSLLQAAEDKGEGDDSSAQAGVDDFAVTEVQSESTTSESVPLFAEDDVVLSVQSVVVLLINDCRASELPFARLTVDGVTAELHSFSHHRNVRGRLRVGMEVFDVAMVTWLPVLEPYTVNAALISSIALSVTGRSTAERPTVPVL